MSKVDEAWRLFSDLQRQYPCWPSTFSMCKCGRSTGRGGGPCVFCISEQLTALVGEDLAIQAVQAMASVYEAWTAIREKLENEHPED